MRKSIVVGIIIILFVLFVCVLSYVRYYEVESSNNIYEDSVIGLSINGTLADTFPSKESGLAIDSIYCDKGASGVWDYNHWMLK